MTVVPARNARTPAAAPLVSVLLPCHNAQPFIDECLASLVAQTLSDFEVLAVDDGSSDGTLERLRDWADRDRRVIVCSQPHTGIVGALQQSARVARGEFLARIDADDVADPDRLSAQVELLRAQPDLAACGTGVRYFPAEQVRDGARAYESWLNSLHQPEQLARDLFVECPIAHPALVVRRAAFERVGGYRDPGWPEDYDLLLRLAAHGFGLANVPRVLLHWRERADRLSRTDPRYSPAAFRACKVHYLQTMLLGGRAVLIWGAGPVGKALARELRAQHVPVCAFIDIDPRKIGQTVYGLPVWPPERLPPAAEVFTVAAVGSSAARQQIRAALHQAGRLELRDFCALA